MGAGLKEGMFSGYSWKYTVHFPARVVSANTADEDIDRETNTVAWEIDLGSAMNESFTMTTTLEPPGGYSAPALIGVILVATVVLVICRMRARYSPRRG